MVEPQLRDWTPAEMAAEAARRRAERAADRCSDTGLTIADCKAEDWCDCLDEDA